MKICICAAIIGLIFATTEALQCYQCANARSDAECNARGPEQCQVNALMCENLVRTRNGQTLYFKQCKQDLACGNNVKGNINGPQCRPGDPIHSECWCCCQGPDGCNEEALPCVGNTKEPSCEEPIDENAIIDCSGNDVLDDGTYPLGSVCRVSCIRDDIVDRPLISTCERSPTNPEVAEFNPRLPLCPETLQVPTCPEPEGFENGEVHCLGSDVFEDGTYPLFSICSYVCNEGFLQEGPFFTTCERTVTNPGVALFNPGPPVCIPTCENPEEIENGFFACDGGLLLSLGHELGSECFYDCDEGYELEGSFSRICELVDGSTSAAEFQPESPRCIPTCGVIVNIVNGKVDCSNENSIGSKCDFSCDDGYTLSPLTTTERECLSNGTWSKPTPCCVENCDPNRPVDIVFTLDSSGSILSENWNIILNFVANFVSNLEISPDAAQVGVFSYNRDVDRDNQVLLGEYKSNKEGLVEDILSIPYPQRKRGTYTGIALGHARKEMFSTEGDRPNAENVLIVLTDGISKDPIDSEASELAKDNVAVFVMGINGEKGLNFTQLTTIARSTQQVFILDDFKELSDRLANDLGKVACKDSVCS